MRVDSGTGRSAAAKSVGDAHKQADAPKPASPAPFNPPAPKADAKAPPPKAAPGTPDNPAAQGGHPGSSPGPGATAAAPSQDVVPPAPAKAPGSISQQTRDTVGAAVVTDRAETARVAQDAGPNRAEIQAGQRNQDAWAQAKGSIAGDIAAQGNGRLDADKVVAPTVAAVRNLAPGSARLQATTKDVVDAQTNSWDAQGTTSSALNRLGSDIKAAKATGTAQAWAPVAAKVSSVLNGGVAQGNQPPGELPQDTSLSLKNQLDARFGDRQVGAVTDAAYNKSTGRLTSMGLSNAQFAPTLAAFDRFHQAQADYAGYLSTNRLPPDLSAAPNTGPGLLQQRVQDGWNATSNAIQGQLRTAASSATAAGLTPQQRAVMVSSATQTIGASGPQTGNFQDNVAYSDWDLRVNQPSQAVKTAFDGQADPTQAAVQGSLTLSEQTAAAGDPRYAAMILDQTHPTIQQIGRQAGILSQPGLNPGSVNPDLQTIYSSMSRAMEPANVMDEKPEEQQAVRNAAQAMLDGIPRDEVNASPYTESGWASQAIAHAVGNGQGAALGMSMAAAAQASGRDVEAGRLVGGVVDGVGMLQSRIHADVDGFNQTSGTLSQVNSTWRGAMSAQQRDAAIDGFKQQNPGLRSGFDAVNLDGVAAGQAVSAWHNFGIALGDTPAGAKVGGAVKDLTGKDGTVATAIASSDWVSNNFWATQATQAGTRPGGQPLAYVGSITSVVKNSKGAIKAGYQNFTAADNPLGQWVGRQFGLAGKPSPTVLGTISGVGAGGYALMGTISAVQGDPVKALYNYVGAGKDTLEAYARFSGSPALKSMFAGTSETVGEGAKTRSAVTGATAGWNGWGAAMSGIATVYDFAGAFKAEKAHDGFAENANMVAGAGDSIGAMRGIVQTGSNLARLGGNDVLADVLGSVAADSGLGSLSFVGGLAALGASLVSAGHQQWKQDDATDAASSRFLQDGLQIPKPAADVIGTAASSQSGRVLEAVARETNQTPGSLLVDLGRKDPEQLRRFMQNALEVAEESPDGNYPVTLPVDPETLKVVGGKQISVDDLVSQYRGL